jgi:hypothetical protein
MAVSKKAAAAALGSSKQRQAFGKASATKAAAKNPANKPGRSGKARSNKASPFGKKT